MIQEILKTIQGKLQIIQGVLQIIQKILQTIPGIPGIKVTAALESFFEIWFRELSWSSNKKMGSPRDNNFAFLEHLPLSLLL